MHASFTLWPQSCLSFVYARLCELLGWLQNKSFELISHNWHQGPVCVDYGERPNEEWMLGYGFTLPGNSDDFIELSKPTAGRISPGHCDLLITMKADDKCGILLIWLLCRKKKCSLHCSFHVATIAPLPCQNGGHRCHWSVVAARRSSAEAAHFACAGQPSAQTFWRRRGA